MGRASTAKRDGRPAKDERVVLWAVLCDGQMGNFLFPDRRAAESSALALREERPASVVEYAQVGVELLMRRPFRPKIERVRAIETI